MPREIPSGLPDVCPGRPVLEQLGFCRKHAAGRVAGNAGNARETLANGLGAASAGTVGGRRRRRGVRGRSEERYVVSPAGRGYISARDPGHVA